MSVWSIDALSSQIHGARFARLEGVGPAAEPLVLLGAVVVPRVRDEGVELAERRRLGLLKHAAVGRAPEVVGANRGDRQPPEGAAPHRERIGGRDVAHQGGDGGRLPPGARAAEADEPPLQPPADGADHHQADGELAAAAADDDRERGGEAHRAAAYRA